MSSNYPPGVTGNERVFHDAEEQTQHVACEAEEGMAVLPSAPVKTVLRDLIATLDLMQSVPAAAAVQRIPAVEAQAKSLLEEVEKLENVGEWQCEFDGDVEVIRTTDDDASWTCPVCGSEEGSQWDEYTREDFESDRAERAYEDARGK